MTDKELKDIILKYKELDFITKKYLHLLKNNEIDLTSKFNEILPIFIEYKIIFDCFKDQLINIFLKIKMKDYKDFILFGRIFIKSDDIEIYEI